MSCPNSFFHHHGWDNFCHPLPKVCITEIQGTLRLNGSMCIYFVYTHTSHTHTRIKVIVIVLQFPLKLWQRDYNVHLIPSLCFNIPSFLFPFYTVRDSLCTDELRQTVRLWEACVRKSTSSSVLQPLRPQLRNRCIHVLNLTSMICLSFTVQIILIVT